MTTEPPVLETLVTAAESAFNTVLDHFQAHLQAEGIGVVHFVGNGIALVTGLPGIKSEELVRFPDNLLGLAFNVDAHEVGVILLGETGGLKSRHRSPAHRAGPGRARGRSPPGPGGGQSGASPG